MEGVTGSSPVTPTIFPLQDYIVRILMSEKYEPKHKMDESLYKIRHSMAHILAEAVLQIRPKAQLGFGPPIRTGFYYDFLLEEPLTETDLPDLEKRMRKIIQEKQEFKREDLPKEQAIQKLV